MRSASPRCAIEKIETRGLPSAVRSSAAGSSGSPSNHWSNPGAASMPFSCSASSKRSFRGKNDSRSRMPTFSNGGDCTCWISDGEVRGRVPACQARRRATTAACARGSAAPLRRRPATGRSSRWRSPVLTSILRRRATEAGGAANELRTDTGKPGAAAGGVNRKIGGRAKPLDPCAILSPVGKPLLPGVRLPLGKVVRRLSRAARLVFIDPGPEVLAAPAAGRSAAGCRDPPWDRSRSPARRRSPLPR